MTVKKDIAQEQNKDYFKSLIATRASLGMLGVSFAGIAIGALDVLYVWGHGARLGWNSPYDPATLILITSTMFMLLSQLFIMIERLRYLLYKHQRFSSVWQLIFVMIFLFHLVFLSTMFAIIGYEGDGDLYGSSFTLPFSCSLLVFYLSCVLYNIYWLRNQLHQGMSIERRLKNGLAKPAVYAPASLGIIVFFMFLVRGFSGDIGYLFFGIGSSILFISVFSRLHVEYAYAAVLKWRDKEYWEEYRREDGIIIPKKKWLSMVRLLIEIGCLLGIGYIRGNLLPTGHPLRNVLRILAFGIVIYWMIRFIRYKMRQNSD